MKKMNKKKGLEDFIIEPVMFLCLFLLFLWFIYMFIDMEKSRDLDRIINQYSLQMESEGYLSTAGQDNLIQDLEEMGISNIQLSGSLANKVGYGETVILEVRGTIETHNIIGINKFEYVKNGDSTNFTKTVKSTAQY